MAVKWILLLIFATTLTHAQLQLKGEATSPAHWKGFPFIKDTNNLNLLATNTCGVYSSADDRQSGTLTFAIDCKSEEHKIKSGFVRDKSAIKIVRPKQTRSYLKKDLYGYRDCAGNEYHFYEGKSFQLISPGEAIAIYRIFDWRGKQRVAKHFFRKGSTGTLEPLTLRNLREEFAGEPLFLEKLSILAGNDFELIRYLYAINRVRMNTQLTEPFSPSL